MFSAVSSQFHVERPSDVHALPAGTILLHPLYSTGHTQLPWLTPSLHLAIDLQLVVKRCVKRSDDDDWPLYEGVNLCARITIDMLRFPLHLNTDSASRNSPCGLIPLPCYYPPLPPESSGATAFTAVSLSRMEGAR